MSKDIEHNDIYSIEDVKDLFSCLNDQNETNQTILEQFCDFLNSSSEELIDDIYRNNLNRAAKSEMPEKNCKTIKISKTFHKQDYSNPKTCNSIDDDFGNVLSTISQIIEELQHCFRNIPYTTDSSNMFFVKFNLIQCELVQVKRFLTIGNFKMKNKKTDSFKAYNNNIMRIVNNRLLMLRLLHFECLLLEYLKSISRTFSEQSDISKDILTTQMQSLFRSYYTLLIKLSYELPVVRMVKILHRKSSSITTDILVLYFTMINSKFTNSENIKSNLPELFDSIINNRSIVIILDYIIILNKIGLLSLNRNMFVGNEHFQKPPSNQFDFDLSATIIDDFLKENHLTRSPQINLVNFGSLILSHFYLFDKFIEKSPLRSRTILMLSSLLPKLKEPWDLFASATLLCPTILKMLKHCNDYHIEICKGSLLNLAKEDICKLKEEERLVEKDIRLKTYLSVLRDVYGMLSMYLVFTETSITNRYLRHLELHQCFFREFLHSFVVSLNGTEESDPETSQTNAYGKICDITEAYSIFNLYRKQYDSVIKCLNRLVIISSIFIQRLLPSLVLPVEDHLNPFHFRLPSGNMMDNQTSDNDFDLDEESVNFPGSDEEYNDLDILNDSELDDEYNINENSTATNNHGDTTKQSFLESYLCFFPENTLFQSNNDRYIGQLSCSCHDDEQSPNCPSVSNEQTNRKNDFISFGQNLNQTYDKPFDWNEVYIKAYGSTKTLIPKVHLPRPDLCFNQINLAASNRVFHPMTYPFLEKAIRYKNYYHIKLLNHIGDRLEPAEDKIEPQLIYDVANGVPMERNETCLKFESRFECGNLRKAYLCSCDHRKNEEEYLLILNTDINSSSHTQWFYFSATKMKPNRKYRFKMVNCDKKSILFNIGQQPLFFSRKEFETSGKTWQRLDYYEQYRGTVAYYRNHFVKNESERALFKGKPFYTLEFTFVFPFDQDECYFAFNTPFSYSFLKTCICYWSFLAQKHNDNQSIDDAREEQEAGKGKNSKIFFASQTLCSTLNGNDLPLITITSNDVDENLKKHYIMITARVHPAESNSSWVLKGFIDFLLHSTEDHLQNQARNKLLDRFIFKIVPMLNPDGVINGCTRTDLQTKDLNRHWGDPSPILHPTIYHTKTFLQCMDVYSLSTNPVAFLDLHGHSRKHNIFSYSCFPVLSWKKSDRQIFHKQSIDNSNCRCNPTLKAPSASDECKLEYQLQSLKQHSDGRMHFVVPPFATLPLIFQYLQAYAFDLNSCSFVMQQDREQTARIVAWRQMQIPLVYTIECSAAGCDKGPYAGMNLLQTELEEMGHYIAESFGFVEFLYCSQKHVPVTCFSKELKMLNKNQDDDGAATQNSVIETLLGRCVRSRTPEKSNSPKQEKLKQLILQLYPDLLSMVDYFK